LEAEIVGVHGMYYCKTYTYFQILQCRGDIIGIRIILLLQKLNKVFNSTEDSSKLHDMEPEFVEENPQLFDLPNLPSPIAHQRKQKKRKANADDSVTSKRQKKKK